MCKGLVKTLTSEMSLILMLVYGTTELMPEAPADFPYKDTGVQSGGKTCPESLAQSTRPMSDSCSDPH